MRGVQSERKESGGAAPDGQSHWSSFSGPQPRPSYGVTTAKTLEATAMLSHRRIHLSLSGTQIHHCISLRKSRSEGPPWLLQQVLEIQGR